MAGAQRLDAAFRHGAALRQLVRALEYIVYLHECFGGVADALAEGIQQFFLYDKHNAAEAGLPGVINRIIHNDLTVRADRIDLLETAVTGAHASSHNDEYRICHGKCPPCMPVQQAFFLRLLYGIFGIITIVVGCRLQKCVKIVKFSRKSPCAGCIRAHRRV